MKKQSNLSRLLTYTGRYRSFTYASWILSAVSALIALVPFWYIWKIIKEVLEVSPNFSEAVNIVSNGIWAVVFAFLSFLVYTGGLMCSHVAAFRIATNMRIALAEHIAKLPPCCIILLRICSAALSATESHFTQQDRLFASD